MCRIAEIVLGIGLANERQCYTVTSSLIGWAQNQNGPGIGANNGNNSGIVPCMRPANERWRYTVTSSLIGWECTQNDPCIVYPLDCTYCYNHWFTWAILLIANWVDGESSQCIIYIYGYLYIISSLSCLISNQTIVSYLDRSVTFGLHKIKRVFEWSWACLADNIAIKSQIWSECVCLYYLISV